MRFIPDFLNIDNFNNLAPDTLYQDPLGQTGAFLFNQDLVRGIPAADGSLEVVYHSHLLEHLTHAEAIPFIAECFRVLQPGGLLRIVVPDLKKWAQHYLSDDTFFVDEYRRAVLADDRVKYPTKGSVFMGMLHNHGHKMGYDFETLGGMLTVAGFNDVHQTLFQDSPLDNIAQAEPYEAIRVMESLCVEGRKPD